MEDSNISNINTEIPNCYEGSDLQVNNDERPAAHIPMQLHLYSDKILFLVIITFSALSILLFAVYIFHYIVHGLDTPIGYYISFAVSTIISIVSTVIYYQKRKSKVLNNPIERSLQISAEYQNTGTQIC
ncbi:Hypothetical_protein [Hexamita inflata]|uniref:Hypothetical_protein n=1 Tax=Hexamita inflata TaxID=28002 RepID=A0AA86NI50_9EUKA|nr:Hypothetical protein HINF_LOCUS7295 [Hexamita inflata]